ncbi:MAG: hypothetical protein P4L79_08045 [Legionella sp.]|uniref:hypothetical protein n=1 Tax=Legionella sp. TaxID=459 RepID=UPI00284BCADB|nr:hypothetical protein [Legionella sp.]
MFRLFNNVKLKVSELNSGNYHNPLPDIDNNLLDQIIFQELGNLTSITGLPNYGVIDAMFYVDKEACKSLISAASNLSQTTDSPEHLKHRIHFEHYLVMTYNSLPHADLNNVKSWSELSREQELEFVLGYILDIFYKNTAVTGKYCAALERFDFQKLPNMMLNLKDIFSDPHKHITQYNLLRRIDEFNRLLFSFKLGLIENESPSLDVVSFNKLLNEYPDVNILDMSGINWRGMNDAGLKLLLDALSNNTSVNELHLERSHLTKQGIILLSEWLRNNDPLEGLFLNGIPIDDESLTCLLNSLNNNKNLKILELSGCNISEKGIELFANFLKANTVISAIALSGAPFTTAALTALLDAVTNNKSLCHLSLNHAQRHKKYSTLYFECQSLEEKIMSVVEENRQAEARATITLDVGSPFL